MTNSSSNWMEPIKRHAQIISVSENRLEPATPIILTTDDISQVHEICILDSGINWTTRSTILFSALLPTPTHALRNSLLNPFSSDFLGQSFSPRHDEGAAQVQ